MSLTDELLFLSAQRIEEIAAKITADRKTKVTESTLHPISWAAINQTTRSISILSGKAVCGSTIRRWSAIVKIIQNIEGNPNQPDFWNYWRAEADAYESNHLPKGNLGFRAPRIYSASNLSPSSAVIFMEHVRGSTSFTHTRYSFLADQICRWNQETARPSLKRSIHRDWFESIFSYRQLVFDIIGNPAFLKVLEGSQTVGNSFRKEIEEILETAPRWLEKMKRVPHAIAHLDLRAPNLFWKETESGHQIVAIDWAFASRAPWGADLGVLLSNTLFFQHSSAKRGPMLEKLLLDGYLGALSQKKRKTHRAEIEFAFYASCVLRTALFAPVFLVQLMKPDGVPALEAQMHKPFHEFSKNWGAAIHWLLSLRTKVNL